MENPQLLSIHETNYGSGQDGFTFFIDDIYYTNKKDEIVGEKHIPMYMDEDGNYGVLYHWEDRRFDRRTGRYIPSRLNGKPRGNILSKQ